MLKQKKNLDALLCLSPVGVGYLTSRCLTYLSSSRDHKKSRRVSAVKQDRKKAGTYPNGTLTENVDALPTVCGCEFLQDFLFFPFSI